MTTRDLDFHFTNVTCPNGDEMVVKLGFGSDGTMWIDPRELGIGPQDAPKLSKFPGGLYLIINSATGEVMINAHAALLAIHDPGDRTRWLAYVEWMLTEHKKIRAKNESARNN
jgi:hypothetical protein